VDLRWHLDKRGVCWQDDAPVVENHSFLQQKYKVTLPSIKSGQSSSISKRRVIPEKEISLATTHECARSGKQKFAMRGGKGRAPARPPARNERDYGKVSWGGAQGGARAALQSECEENGRPQLRTGKKAHLHSIVISSGIPARARFVQVVDMHGGSTGVFVSSTYPMLNAGRTEEDIRVKSICRGLSGEPGIIWQSGAETRRRR
jgi:hypothetical protein